MSQPEIAPDFFDRQWGKLKGFTQSWWFKRAQSALELDLRRIIETANGHRAKKVPAGHQVYVELYGKANEKIDTFCKKWNVKRSVIEREAPALHELEQLTHPAQPVSKLLIAISSIIALIAVALATGVLSGVVHAGYAWSNGCLSHLFR